MGPGDRQDLIMELLLMQHITPSATTGCCSVELLTGHQLQSLLNWLHLGVSEVKPGDYINLPRTFILEDLVYAQNHIGDIVWVPLVIVGVSSPQLYQVTLEDQRFWRCHIDWR